MKRKNAPISRGVSLPETMAVLVIVALLLGIALSLLSVAHTWMKSNETVIEISSILSTIHKSDLHSDYNSINNQALVDTGLIPKRWVSNDKLIDPFGGQIFVSGTGTDTSSQITLSLRSIPRGACTALAHNEWGNSLVSIQVNNVTMSPGTVCLQSSNSIVMVFH